MQILFECACTTVHPNGRNIHGHQYYFFFCTVSFIIDTSKSNKIVSGASYGSNIFASATPSVLISVLDFEQTEK